MKMDVMEAPESPGRAQEIGATPQPKPMRAQLGPWDLGLLAAASLSLTVNCVLISGKKPFWNDELVAWFPITDPSVGHMLRALANGVDGAPPLYHILARLWLAIWGKSELSLRLFSSSAMCFALVVLWIKLRKYFPLRATAFGLLTIWCGSGLLLMQNSEARNYGLFCAMAAVAIAAYVALVEYEKPPAWLLVAATVAQAALLFSHIYGLLYSGALLAALIISDLLESRFRLKVYLSVTAGWIVLLPWLPTLQRVAAVAKPYGWIPVPDLDRLGVVLGFYLPVWPLVAFAALAALGSICASREPSRREEVAQPPVARALLTLAVGFMFVPVIAFIVSQFSKPIFVDRYLLPSAMGAAVLLVQLAALVLGRTEAKAAWKPLELFSGQGLLNLAWAALLACFIAYPVVVAERVPAGRVPNPVVEPLLPPGVPVVTEFVYDFMVLSYYSKLPDRPYYFVVDPEVALDPRSPHDQPFLNNERMLWARNGYFTDRTSTTAEFLCRNENFLVLQRDGLYWFQERVRKDLAFDTQELADLGDRSLWMVKRRPGQQPRVCADGR